MKYRMRLAVLGVVLLAILIGCTSDQEFRDLKIVANYLGQHTDIGDVAYCDAGPLAGGTAVHFPDRDAAFWVKEGVIYPVNENAKTARPQPFVSICVAVFQAPRTGSGTGGMAWQAECEHFPHLGISFT